MHVERARDIVKNCRFCLMCRHACTTAKFTKNESDAPRAIALNLWTVLEGMRTYTLNDAETLYRCVDCQKCKAHCISDYDVPTMVELARRDLVEAGLVPDSIQSIRKDILEKGNPFGAKKAEADPMHPCETLVFPGCDTAYNAPEFLERFLSLLTTLGIKFQVLRDTCCGAPLKSLGYYEDARRLLDEVLLRIRGAGAKEILFLCPHCFLHLTQNVSDLGMSLPQKLEAKLHLDFLDQMIDKRRLKPRSGPRRKILIHDSCTMGRRLQHYELPRKLLKKLPGIESVEMFLNKSDSPCCGGSVITRRVSPEMGKHSADIILSEGQLLGVDGLMTTCPSCRIHLNRHSTGVQAYDPLELLVV